jgi:hypothetical protein
LLAEASVINTAIPQNPSHKYVRHERGGLEAEARRPTERARSNPRRIASTRDEDDNASGPGRTSQQEVFVKWVQCFLVYRQNYAHN